MGVSTLDNQCAPRLSALLSKTPILCAEIFNKRPSAYSKKNVVRIMIIYFNIDSKNLLSFTAILNFAVCWCEICNQEIFGAARISYNMSLHTRQAIGSYESFSTVPDPRYFLAPDLAPSDRKIRNGRQRKQNPLIDEVSNLYLNVLTRLNLKSPMC